MSFEKTLQSLVRDCSVEELLYLVLAETHQPIVNARGYCTLLHELDESELDEQKRKDLANGALGNLEKIASIVKTVNRELRYRQSS